MYWSFSGSELDEKTIQDNIIYKLGNFLISKPDFFYFTMDILITCKSHSPTNSIYDLERIKNKIKRAILDGSINADDEEDFLNLFKEYNDDNKIQKGELLDYIIYKIGPHKLTIKGFNKRRKCKVSIKGKLCSEKDFDVVFYKEEEFLFAEIIECKLDVNTFIHHPPSDKNSFSQEANQKLQVMEFIHRNKRVNDNLSFYLATFRKNVESCKRILKAAGFDFISILNGDNLFELLLKKIR